MVNPISLLSVGSQMITGNSGSGGNPLSSIVKAGSNLVGGGILGAGVSFVGGLFSGLFGRSKPPEGGVWLMNNSAAINSVTTKGISSFKY